MATKNELAESYESLSGAVDRACYEMDRLREVNRELLEALQTIRDLDRKTFREAWDMLHEVDRIAGAAIRKAKGGQ